MASAERERPRARERADRAARLLRRVAADGWTAPRAEDGRCTGGIRADRLRGSAHDPCLCLVVAVVVRAGDAGAAHDLPGPTWRAAYRQQYLVRRRTQERGWGATVAPAIDSNEIRSRRDIRRGQCERG